ncbi:MAG: hypothetical protein M3O24_02215 [Thermoproteota archaeon]|nr:hypothetical protein [Thermoproteota archaeon]
MGQTRNVLLIILITVAMALVTSVLAYTFDLLVTDSQVFFKHLTYIDRPASRNTITPFGS